MPLENLEGIVLNIVPETNPFGSGKAGRIVTHAHQKLFGKIVHYDQISYSEFAQDYVTGTFSRGRFRHCIFSAGRVIQMKIQFFSKALKGNLKNEVLKAAFAAGLRGIFVRE